MSKKVIAALSFALVLGACNTSADLTVDEEMMDASSSSSSEEMMIESSSSSEMSSDMSSSSEAAVDGEVEVQL